MRRVHNQQVGGWTICGGSAVRSFPTQTEDTCCLCRSLVRIPYGGASLFPLQAAVCSPLDVSTSLAVTRRLLAVGADPNTRWRDCGGEQTALSKALVLHRFLLGEVLVAHGADCTAALLETDLLQSSRFDADLVGWLLDRGASVAPPNTRAPPVAVLLSKLQRELHAGHELAKLHAGGGSGQEPQLLRGAASCLERLLAAGACPAGAAPLCLAIHQAAAALLPAHWAAVREAATTPPRWSPQTHRLFPRPFREAARAFLLVAGRGFGLGGSGCAGQLSGGSFLNADRGPPETGLRWASGGRLHLDNEIVLFIIRLAAPCSPR